MNEVAWRSLLLGFTSRVPAVGLVGTCLSQALGAGLESGTPAHSTNPCVDRQSCDFETEVVNRVYSTDKSNLSRTELILARGLKGYSLSWLERRGSRSPKQLQVSKQPLSLFHSG